MALYLRSLLFVPAVRPDRFSKALATKADAVCLDLEDSVPAERKSDAREQIRVYFQCASVEAAPRQMVRINAWNSEDGIRDALALFDQAVTPAAVLVPKVESADSLAAAAAIFARHSIPLIALIETVAGLRIADSIARVPGVGALVFGSADYAAEVGCTMSATALAAPRAHVAQAAGSAGIGCLDGAWLKIDDIAGLRNDCEVARDLGFVGKPALHPGQLDTIHAAFTLDAETVAEARAILAAFAASAGGVVMHRGRMLDAPVVAQARRTIAVGAPHSMSQGDRP